MPKEKRKGDPSCRQAKGQGNGGVHMEDARRSSVDANDGAEPGLVVVFVRRITSDFESLLSNESLSLSKSDRIRTLINIRYWPFGIVVALAKTGAWSCNMRVS